MSKIFITGASGFVGQKLVSAIDKKNNTVRVLSRRILPGLETVVCDLYLEDIPDNALKGVDTVFHLAGIAHDSESLKQDDQYINVNVKATEKLAKLAVISGVRKFIYLSSVKAGGNSLTVLTTNEHDHFEPKGIYGKTKREAELKLLEIGLQSGMHVSVIRSSLVYGPSMKGSLGMMFSGIKKGWFPSLPKVANRRSMVHVDDLVKAIFLLASDIRANGEIFIVTDGVPHSSREIYEIMCTLSGREIPKWYLPKVVFNFAAFFSLDISRKVNKLFEDDYYSSEKIQSIGFKPQRSLKEMNETFI
jgi:nucleoside-diphosphate-sugar epimerase